MSDAGLGPKLIHYSPTYRIESFFEGRPITIWEMRNPVFINEFVKKIYQMHSNENLNQAIHALSPKDPSNLAIDIAINEWGPACLTRIPSIRSKLRNDISGHELIE